MNKRTFFITLLIILSIMIAGCAGTKSASTPAAPSTQQEQAGSNVGEAVDGELAEPEEEKTQQDTETETVNNQSAVEAGAKFDSSNEVQPVAANNQVEQVRLLVTRNFGSQIILQETVGIEKDWTIMELLNAKMKVETRYGGGFIDNINGLKSSSSGLSGEMQDWFYYVNGICPDVGGLDYIIDPGEVIWWDYHVWKAGFANAAVVGCYPEPFLHGYKGKIRSTTIMCPTDDLAAGHELEKALKAKGVANIKVMQIDEGLLANRQGPTIVLGEWEKLQHSPFIQDFNQAYKRNGTGIHFNDMKLELLDIKGQVKRNIEGSGGVIAAAGSGLGDPCPLWLLSGTDLKGFQLALDTLINNPGKITGRYNAAITAGEVISVPCH
ncbi:hypothetical protein ASZ90_019131 [hydrocarbon metagenome]|uniref:Transcobalamin-like C-terminal domain-containing protein n=1 Tax=hydrocarbon metagenome TaxID=938273 RepID=A0A0W8E4A7_9ZZZZ